MGVLHIIGMSGTVIYCRPLLVNVADDDITDVIKYYHTGADSPLSHALFNIGEECGGMCVYDRVQSWLDHVPDGKDPIWMVRSISYYDIVVFN